MAAKSIIDIEVNSKEFERFSENWRKYQDSLTKQPEVVRKSGKEVLGLSDSFKKITDSLNMQAQLLFKIAESTGGFAKNTKEAAKHMKDAEESAKKMVTGGFMGIGMGGIMGGIGAAASGAGGMMLGAAGMIGNKIVGGLKEGFGMVKDLTFALATGGGNFLGMDRLGAAGYSGYRSSGGLGMNYGHMKAAQNVFGPTMNVDAMMQAVSTARGDVQSRERRALLSMGISPTKGTADDTLMAVREKAYQFAHNTSESMWGPRLRSSGLGNAGVDIETLRRMKGQTRGQFEAENEEKRQLAKQADVEKQALEKWKNFYKQIDAASTRIESGLLEGLSAVAPLLTEMSRGLSTAISNMLKSDDFKKNIEFLAKQLEGFANYLGGPDFQKDLQDFGTYLKELVEGLKKAVAWISRNAPWVTSPVQKGIEELGGPAVGTPENKKTADAIKDGLIAGIKYSPLGLMFQYNKMLYDYFTKEKTESSGGPTDGGSGEGLDDEGRPAAPLPKVRGGRGRSVRRGKGVQFGASGGSSGGYSGGTPAVTGSGAGGYAGGVDVMRGDIEYFMKMGWTYEQAAGIVGNIQEESQGSANPKGSNDGGLAFGLAQWHPDRQAKYKELYGTSMQADWKKDPKMARERQRAFIHHELTKGNEQKAGAALRGETTVHGSFASVARHYERPSAANLQSRLRSSTGVNVAAAVPRSSLNLNVRVNVPASVETNTNQVAAAQ